MKLPKKDIKIVIHFDSSQQQVVAHILVKSVIHEQLLHTFLTSNCSYSVKDACVCVLERGFATAHQRLVFKLRCQRHKIATL